MSESTEMVVEAKVTEDPNVLPVKYRTIAIETLASHCYEFGTGRNKVRGLDAAGVRFIAGCMGLSIESMEIEETPTDLIGKAKAVTKDGRSYFGYTTQPKKNPNGQPNKHAYAACATKAQRNALLGLIPANLMDEAIAASQTSDKSMLDNPLAKVKTEARNAIRNARKRLDEVGITPEQIYAEAQNEYGPVDDWDLGRWTDFRNDIRRFKECQWIQRMVSSDQPF